MELMQRAAALDSLVSDLRDRLLRSAGGDDGSDARGRIRSLVDAEAGVLDEQTRSELVDRLIEESFGLGPLEPLMADPEVDEIMVCGLSPVWVERRGRLEPTGARFESEAALRHAIERILSPVGRRVDESQPLADARLPDGSRVNVVIPPLALDGPSLTIRRFRRHGHSPEDLIANGTLDPAVADLLARAVRSRLNILVCGGTGSGKTTTLNALSSHIGARERVVTIEDAAELRLQQPHVVRLEARPANLDGRGEVTIRALVRNALRMRPDRIVVGEVRGPEALDMLSALATGHDGSMSTIHAGTPAEAVRRLETLSLMAEVGLPHSAIREQIAAALHLVVCQTRAHDGSRRVTSVAEVVRVAGGVGIRELYELRDGRPWWRPALANGPAGGLA